MLSLLLVLTGQAMAFARGQAPADGQMVLCTGHGAVVVYMDSDGQPTSPPQLCADAMHAFSALISAQAGVSLAAQRVVIVSVQDGAHLLSAPRPSHVSTRAPPA